MFQNRIFWDGMRIPRRELRKRYEYFFGREIRKIEDREEALAILMNITSTIQNEMVSRLKTENTYGILLKIYFIFDEVHSIYLKEKEERTKCLKLTNNSVVIHYRYFS